MNITYLPFRITEDFPSSIVADYDKFLSQVQAPSSYLTKSKHWINRSTLYSLNQDVQKPSKVFQDHIGTYLEESRTGDKSKCARHSGP